MKTIKELETEIEKIEMSIENVSLTTDKFRDGFKRKQLKQAELKALKDVLKLIDEWAKEHRIETCGALHLQGGATLFPKDVEELKSRIQGK